MVITHQLSDLFSEELHSVDGVAEDYALVHIKLGKERIQAVHLQHISTYASSIWTRILEAFQYDTHHDQQDLAMCTTG